MRRIAGWIGGAIAVLGSALVLACGPRSMVEEDDDIVVDGTVLAATGAPASGQRVRMMREPSFGELLSFVANPIGVGLWCVVRELEEEPGCITFRRADADAQGVYTMTMRGSETQKEFGAARHFWIGSTSGGASIGIGLYVQDPMVVSPT